MPTKAKAKPKPRGRAPVPGFPIKYRWQSGDWEDLFDRHVEHIRDELRRAQVEDRTVIYLSCPISTRGGGHRRTNVDIANHTARRLMMEWGPRFFVLNPSQYQMESKEGTGLSRRHAERLSLETGRSVDVDRLMEESPPSGGDYMRMWTRVLVEDDYLEDAARRDKNLGGLFDVYYFLSPLDARGFFTKGGATTVTAGVEEYFARMYAMDFEFRRDFSPPFYDADGDELRGAREQAEFERRRRNFFRFYAVRASAQFSKGCHDEWNIWVRLNRKRLRDKAYGIGEEIAGFYEGAQLSPGAAMTEVPNGYAV